MLVATIGCLLWLFACSEKTDDTPGTGGSDVPVLTGGAGGTGGASGMYGTGGFGGTAATGGSDTAGIGGTGGEIDAYNKADHCSPGEYVNTYSSDGPADPNRGVRCIDADYDAAGAAGVFTGEHFPSLRINSVELAVPLQTGTSYAASFEVEVRSPLDPQIFQIWGTDAKCGAGSQADLLYEVLLQEGKQIVCSDLAPAKNYTHLLVVIRDEDDKLTGGMVMSFVGATYCSTGRCP